MNAAGGTSTKAMITPHGQAAVERNNARLAELENQSHTMKVLEEAVAFSSSDTTRSEKLEACVRCAAEKLRIGDCAGALLTLEQGMRI